MPPKKPQTRPKEPLIKTLIDQVSRDLRQILDGPGAAERIDGASGQELERLLARSKVKPGVPWGPSIVIPPGWWLDLSAGKMVRPSIRLTKVEQESKSDVVVAICKIGDDPPVAAVRLKNLSAWLGVRYTSGAHGMANMICQISYEDLLLLVRWVSTTK